MKISCTKDNLFRGLSTTSHITTKNVNLPILNNVLLKADGGNIRLTTTNLEIAVTCLIRGKVDEEGEFTVPSKLFYEYINLLPNEKIDLELKDDSLMISCAGHKTKILGLSASDFPLVPQVATDQTYLINVDEMKSSLNQALFAVATNESRPELTGLSVSFHNESSGKGTITFAATDSYRLAERITSIGNGGNSDALSVIIPSKTMTEINRVLSLFKDDIDSPEQLTVSLSDNQIVFQYGSVEIISRVIDGIYPDYKQIIPENFRTEAIVDKDDFAKAVKTASLFSKTGLFDITVSLKSSENQVTVNSVDTSRGENTTNCAADISGEDNHVTLNYRYLLDGLNAIHSDKVSFRMIDAQNPCLLTPMSDNTKYLYVVMPIRQ